jgi:hypothetical protein
MADDGSADDTTLAETSRVDPAADQPGMVASVTLKKTRV